MHDYKRESFQCADCRWVGPGAECRVTDSFGPLMVIGCPACEAMIRVVPLDPQLKKKEFHWTGGDLPASRWRRHAIGALRLAA